MNHENSIGWEDFRKFLPSVVENPFQGTPDKKAMGQTAERSQGYFVPDFVGHARSLIDLLKTVGMNPGLVGADPLLVYEGKAFLHILDFGQPRGMPKEGNLNPVFQEKSCIGLWGGSPTNSKVMSGGVISPRFWGTEIKAQRSW